MKKIRFLSIGALLLVSLAACANNGGNGGGGSGGGSGGGGTETKTDGIKTIHKTQINHSQQHQRFLIENDFFYTLFLKI